MSEPQQPWPYDDAADQAEAVREEQVIAPPADLPEITAAHVKHALLRSMLWEGIFAFATASVLLMIWGWPTAALLLIGAGISASGLWEWQRLVELVTAKIEKQKFAGTTRVVVGFFVRLMIAGALVYVSLKCLHGSVFALMGGLALAVPALGMEAGRLVRASTRAAE